MIHIGNVKNPVYPDIQHIACHRPHPLGNPFHIGKDGTREEVIIKYKAYLNEQIKNKNANIIMVLKEIEHIYLCGESVCLDCYCAPESCHTEVIRLCVLSNVVDKVFGEYQSMSFFKFTTQFGALTKQSKQETAKLEELGLIKGFLDFSHVEYQSLGFQRF